MAIQDEVREDLALEVFAEIGKPVTLISKSTPIYNNRDELESVTNTTSTITVVPYNITYEEQTRQEFGNMKEGDMMVAVPYDVADTINIDDQLIIESENWNIKSIEKNYLPDNVVSIMMIRPDRT